ncbi:hypothetical protein VU00_10572 [Candidatus Electrothrix marina]|uniref:Lcl C-terminal domain-containing protein n=1 Tax=Candidatus Electrothrix marina TaxID=1859130 RepID=A0A444JBU1_9BACT|nr:hypothetical protein VU00_10572 [Candidatus Electrothrix marina]
MPGGVALSVTASANNWLLYLPAILAGSGGGTTPPPVTTQSNNWLLFLPAILAGSQGGTEPPVTIAGGLNDTGIVLNSAGATCEETSEEDCNYGRDKTVSDPDPSDGHAGFSFTQINSSTCVLDNVTGLAWEVKTAENKDLTYTWAQANDYATNAGGVGFPGCGGSYTCRLPTAKELLGLVAFGSSPDYIDKNFFPNNMTSVYWTGTPAANDPGVDPTTAWAVNFAISHLDRTNNIDNSFYSRAVCE